MAGQVLYPLQHLKLAETQPYYFLEMFGGYAAFPNVLDKAVAQYPEASLFMLAWGY